MMTNFSLYKVTLVSLLLLIAFLLLLKAPSLQAAGLIFYCWNNEDGVQECGNMVPPQYSQKGFKRCKSGKCKFIKPAPTKEEIAELERQEEEKQKRQQKTNKDCQFLNTFSSVTDIELARTTARDTIDAQKQPIEMLLEALKGNLEDQTKNYELSKMNPSVSENQLNAIQREIQAVANSIAKQNQALQDKLQEQAQIHEKYNNYVNRYMYLTGEGVVSCQQNKEGNFYFICKGRGMCEIEPLPKPPL